MNFSKLYFRFLLMLTALTAVAWFMLGKPVIGIDDANIFLRYARNFANGDGFVYNAGGERVEGFTSFLWVLVCAGFYTITSNPEILIGIFLLLCTTLTITMVYTTLFKELESLSDGFLKRNFFWLYSGFIICIGPSLGTWWILSLMENGLWSMLFTTIVVLLMRVSRNNDLNKPEQLLGLAAAFLMVLTRPEALAWGVIFSALFFLIRYRQGKGYLFPTAFLITTAVSAVSLVMFRLYYFGYPLPNTFYAKVSGDRLYNIVSGFKYLLNFVANFNTGITMLFAALLATLGHILAQPRKMLHSTYPGASFRFRLLLAGLILIAGLCLPLLTGGDHFGGFRFYQHLLPLFAWALPAALWLREEAGNSQPSVNRMLWISGSVFFLLVSFATVNNLKNIPKTQMDYDFFLAKDGRQTGAVLNAYWVEHHPSIGVIPAGGIAVTYKGETLDLMGLNNTKMGHSKGDRKGIKNHAAFHKETFYDMNAKFLLPKLMTGPLEARQEYMDLLKTDNFENQAMKNIFNDSLFQRAYQPVMVRKNGLNPVFGFAAKDWLPVLEREPGIQVYKISQVP